MTNADLQQFGGDITPLEMYDALLAAQAYFNNTNEIPNIMPTLNCLRYVVKRDFDLEEQLKDRYNREHNNVRTYNNQRSLTVGRYLGRICVKNKNQK